MPMAVCAFLIFFRLGSLPDVHEGRSPQGVLRFRCGNALRRGVLLRALYPHGIMEVKNVQKKLAALWVVQRIMRLPLSLFHDEHRRSLDFIESIIFATIACSEEQFPLGNASPPQAFFSETSTIAACRDE